MKDQKDKQCRFIFTAIFTYIIFTEGANNSDKFVIKWNNSGNSCFCNGSFVFWIIWIKIQINFGNLINWHKHFNANWNQLVSLVSSLSIMLYVVKSLIFMQMCFVDVRHHKYFIFSHCLSFHFCKIDAIFSQMHQQSISALKRLFGHPHCWKETSRAFTLICWTPELDGWKADEWKLVSV